MAEKLRSINLSLDLKNYENNKKNFDTQLDRKIKDQMREQIELNIDEDTQEYYKNRKERIEEIDGEISSYNELLGDLDSSLQKKDIKELLMMLEQLNLEYPIVNVGTEIVNGESVSVVDNETIIDTSEIRINSDGTVRTSTGILLTEDQILKIKKEMCSEIKEQQSQIISNAITKLEDIKLDIPYELLKEKKDYNNYIKEFNAEEMHTKMENLTSEYKDSSGNVVYDDYVSYKEYLEKNGNISPIEFLQAHYMLYNPDTTYKLEKLNRSNYGLKGDGLENFDNISLDEIITLSYELLYIKDINPDYEQIYNYLYYTEGIEKANEYLALKKEEIHKQVGEKRAEEFLNGLSEAGDVETYLKTTGKGFMDGIDSFCEGIDSWVNSSDVKSAEEYEKMYILMALQSQEDKKAQGLIDENGNSNSKVIDYAIDYAKGSQYVYKYSQAIGNIAPSIALSMINPTVGTASLGVSAGGQNYHEALVEGYNDIQALTYGALTGVTAATMERMLGTLPGLGKKEASTLIGKMLSEGGEEALEQLVQSGVWDTLILGKEINLENLGIDVVQSAIDGAIVSGILNAPGSTITIVNKGVNTAINLEQAKQIKNLLDSGMTVEKSIDHVLGISNLNVQGDISIKTTNSQINEDIQIENNLETMVLDVQSQLKEAISATMDNISDKIRVASEVISKIETETINFSNDNVNNMQMSNLANNPSYINNGQENMTISFMDRFKRRMVNSRIKKLSQKNAYKIYNDALKFAEINGDENVKIIVKNLYKLKELRPNFFIDITPDGTGAYSNSYTDGSIFIGNQVINGEQIGVIFHELGHTLHGAINNSAVPINYNQVYNNVYNHLCNNTGYVADVMKYLNDSYAYYSNLANNMYDPISVQKSIESELKKINWNSVAKQYRKLGYTEEYIQNILNQDYNARYTDLYNKKYNDFLFQMTDNLNRQAGLDAVSDIISSVFYGAKHFAIINSLNEKTYLGGDATYKHDTKYFRESPNPTEASFHEQIANYIQLKFTNNELALEILDNFLGKEWTNMMEIEFNKIVNYFKN